MKPLFRKIYKEIDRAKGRRSIARHGFWFVDIPRTSSSSIRSELGSCFGRAYGKTNVIETEHVTAQTFAAHMPAKEMRALLGGSVWNKIFTFTIVRNPWGRVYSMYHYRKMKCNIPSEWGFRDYVLALGKAGPDTPFFKYRGYRYGASEYVLGDKDEVIVDFIAKYENRSHDLNLIASRIKMDSLGELSIQAASPENKHYSRFYDAETREIIRRLYAKDIEFFDYEYLDEK